MPAGAESSLVAAAVLATAERAAMKLGAASANASTNIPPWCNLRMISLLWLSRTVWKLGSTALLSRRASCCRGTGNSQPWERYAAVIDLLEAGRCPGLTPPNRRHGRCKVPPRGGRRQRGDSVGESCRGRRIHRQRPLLRIDFRRGSTRG